MRIGLIGLGRMGMGIGERLVACDHEVVGFDLSADARDSAGAAGLEPADSLDGLVNALSEPRAVWVMVPHGEATRRTVLELAERLEPGDLVVDGGNSRWSESLRNAGLCGERGVHFLDIGVSGGVWGRDEGFNLMVGGPVETFERLEPVLRDLAPEGGYARVGENGAGHFVKMIHNAVEYGMLQAIGEGFECLHRSEFDLDLAQVAHLWRHGSVVRSWLLELLARALDEEGSGLGRIRDHVEDSGTGRWSVEWAVENAVPIPVITASLYERFASRQDYRYAAKAIAALRHQFGGHAVREGARGGTSDGQRTPQAEEASSHAGRAEG